ncbi:hypothetical protein GX917_00480 [Candidatus Falkowbacteria bacterium]|jgi:hypothetical protein|nr:hypothetical protein [Candidatus Falkowbacteria bacterium]
MRNFNPFDYRNELSKELKKQREGGILSRAGELFLSQKSKEERAEIRREKARDFLDREKSSYKYIESDHAVHPQKVEKIKQAREDWNKRASERMKSERIKNLEEFKKEYPEFESFLKNEDFSLLVENGVTKISIQKGSKEYEDLLAIEPYKNMYGFQCAHVGENSAHAKIITENESIEVKPRIYSEDDMGDGQVWVDEVAGEKVGDVIEKMESLKNVALSTYSNGSPTFVYRDKHMTDLTPFLEKLDPEFFSGGGRWTFARSGGDGSEDMAIFKNKEGESKVITPGDFGDFIKEDSTLYLIKE